MAAVPHQWEAYARLQRKLSSTNCVTIGAALEVALNVVDEPGFKPEAIAEVDFVRIAATAARQERHRALLRRRARAHALGDSAAMWVNGDGDVGIGARSLDDVVHARRELARLAAALREPDWDLLTAVAAGVPYDELAFEHESTSPALRSRVCRLRQAIA